MGIFDNKKSTDEPKEQKKSVDLSADEAKLKKVRDEISRSEKELGVYIETKRALDVLKEVIAVYSEQKTELESVIAERKDELKQLDLDLEKRDAINDEIRKAEGTLGSLVGDIKEANIKYSDLVAELDKKKEELSGVVGQIDEQVKTLTVQKESLEAEVASLQTQVDEAESSKTAAEDRKLELEGENGGLLDDIVAKKATISELQNEIGTFERKKDNLSAEVESGLAKVEQAAQKREAALDVREKDLVEREGAVSDKESFLKEKEAHLRKIKGELEKFHGKKLPVNI